MFKTYLISYLILATLISKAQNTSLEWAKSMGGQYGLATGISVAVDNSNNVYSTGTFEGKVDFDPGIGLFNLTTSTYGNKDVFICKYDNSGNFIWARQIVGSYSYDYVSSIAIDDSGNIYAAGYFEGTLDCDPGPGTFNLSSNGDASFILKLNSSGNFVWAKQLGSVDTRIYSMTVDMTGNVYSTGTFWYTSDFDPGPATYNLTAVGSDAFVSKLDAAGSFVWAKQLGSTNWNEYTNPNSIAVDVWGSVYTTGYFTGTIDFDPGTVLYHLTASGGQDIYISKLNSLGDFVWAKQLSGPGQESATSITVDFIGDVFTTGNFKDSVDFDPGPASSYLTSSGDFDMFISKLDASGSFGWAKKIGGSYYDSGKSIALDGAGNILIAGNFGDTCDFDPGVGTFFLYPLNGADIFVSKLNFVGNFVWAKQLGGPGIDNANSIAVNSSGNVYTTGYFNGTADFDPGAATFNLTGIGNCVFTSQLTAAGNFAWANSAGKSAGIYSKSLATDPFGNILAAGSFYGSVDFDPGPGVFNLSTSVPEKDIFIYKSDASGNLLWAKQLTGTADDNVSEIAVDSSGNNYITGYFQGAIDFDPGAGSFILTSLANASAIFISKYDASGNFIWAKQINNTSSIYSINATAITMDNAGKILLTGYFSGTADFDPGPAIYNLTAGLSVFILKLDASGNFVWAKQFAGGTAFGYSITTDGGGNILTSGDFYGSVDFDPGTSTYNLSSGGGMAVFISKLNASGNFVWAKEIGVNLINNISGKDYHFILTTDNYGNVYSSSCFKDTVDLDPGAGVYNLISPYDDIYILKLDAGGNFVWAKQFGGGHQVRTTLMTADIYGNVYTTGYFNVGPDFDPGPGTFYLGYSGSYTSFISKLDTAGSFVGAYKTSGIAASEFVNGYSICLDKSGDIYTTGAFNGTCDFDPDSAGIFNIASIGNPDMYIHKLSQCPWANITPSGAASFCSGGNILLSANTGSGSTYQWKKNGNNISGATVASYVATTAGNYNVVVSSSCGVATSPMVVVTANPLPSAIITAAGPTTFCSGNSVLLNALVNVNYSYQWNKNGVVISGATHSKYAATTSGTYKVMVTNNVTGCSKTTATAAVVTVNPIPKADITPQGPTTFCAGGSVMLSANSGTGLIYAWKKGYIFISGATLSNYTATTAGTYKVQVTKSNGCSKLSAGTLVTVPCKLSEGENIPIARFDVKVYPNPSSGDFTFEITNTDDKNIFISIYDAIGKKIGFDLLKKSTSNYQISNLPPGVFSAEIICGENKKVIKLVKIQ
jgi:hypothetical protein